tara:strand:+ start:1631 stop:2143 length:513 start_codon:yes stop_codon:yes gene_type:complete
MSLLEIITAPDPILKKVSLPVERIGEQEIRLMDDMLETMYAAPGVGLSAIQVGVAKRIIVIDAGGDDRIDCPLKIVNPKIIWKNNEEEYKDEGCLSFPDQQVSVKRPTEIEIEYLDEKNNKRNRRSVGLECVAIQHEIDHLDGILLIDSLSSIKRNIILRKMKKLKKNNS